MLNLFQHLQIPHTIVLIVPFIRITNITNTATAAAMNRASTKLVNSALSAAAQPPRNLDSSLG